MTILFVDDDKDTRELFQVVFSIIGHQVEMAGSGQEALSLLNKTHFDVAVVDYFMPGINGLEMVHQFNETRAQNRTSFVLFTQAHRGDLDERAKELGVVCLVHKPALPDLVVEAVEQAALSLGENWNTALVAPLPKAKPLTA